MNDPTYDPRQGGHDDPSGDVPVGAPALERGATLTCVREMYALTDEFGRTWIAVGPEGPVFSGGVMSHLVAGQTATVVSSGADGLVLRLRGSDPHALDQDLPAYLLPFALVPTFDTRPAGAPAATAT